MPWSETLRKNIIDENDLADYFVYLYTSPIKMYRDTKICKYFIGGLGQRYISIQLKNGKTKLVQSWNIISEAAYNIIKTNFPKLVDEDKNVVFGHFPRKLLNLLRFEHIIPSGLIHDRCLELAKEGKMNRENALNLLRSIYISLVTVEEDKALTKAGLRDKLPEGYDPTFSDLGLSRYEKTGIILHKW
jgi:hypothetical protein